MQSNNGLPFTCRQLLNNKIQLSSCFYNNVKKVSFAITFPQNLVDLQRVQGKTISEFLLISQQTITPEILLHWKKIASSRDIK